MNIRVRGLSEATRHMDITDEAVRNGIRKGMTEASAYLKDKIKEKFGHYQSTGGSGGGPWKRLDYKTIVRKRKKGFGGNANSPLVKTGKMRDSIVNKVRNDGMEAIISSNDEKILYHIYGAPRKGIPKRDPMLITSQEEEENVVRILEEAVYDEIFKDL